jgi:tetratricopeptide (TPR) repeat protein
LRAIGLIGAVLFAYWPALHGGFLWDDSGHVTGPGLQSLSGLKRIWLEFGATQQYYPLLHSAFWVEHRLWGENVTGYHLLNVTMHAASALLVVGIAGQLRLPGRWLAGLIFALHPVHVESVAWISEQKNTLSTLFSLAAGWAYLEFDRTRRPRAYWLASLLFACAMLSKTSSAMLPAVLIVVLWWRRGRLTMARDVGPLIPWLAFGLAGGLLTAKIERDYIGATGDQFALSPFQRILLAGRIPWFYLGKLLRPAGLTFNYPRWTVSGAVWWQWIFPAALCAAIAGCWRIKERRRGPLAAVLCFTALLFPVLGFLNVYPFVFSFVADHFQYVASLAVIIPFASMTTEAARRFRISHNARVVMAAVAVLTLALATRSQSAVYRDAETLYRATIARNPQSWMAHENLGVELIARPDGLFEAITEFTKAVRLRPDSARAHRNLAMALTKLPARREDAIAEYEAALRLIPNSYADRLNIGGLLLESPGRRPAAVAHLEAAVRLQPDSATAHYMLGNALSPADPRRAEGEYRTAIQLAPAFAEPHVNLGNLLASQQRHEQAIAEYRAALGIRPDYADAHYNLANQLMEIPERRDEAIAHFMAALRIRPDSPEAHNNLALVLLDTGRRKEAIEHLETALRLDPGFAPARHVLDQVRSESPRTPE